MVWSRGDSFTATLAANYIDGETTVGRPFVRLAPDAAPETIPLCPNSVTLPRRASRCRQYGDQQQFRRWNQLHSDGGSLKLEIGLPAAHTLVSISSYDSFELHDLLDQDVHLRAHGSAIFRSASSNPNS